jgi:hypothetical protein
MSQPIDLDALQPEAAIIKFNGEEITLNPPKTGDVLTLGQYATKLATLEGLTPDEVNAVIETITQLIYKIVPALNNAPLNTTQLLVLVKAISDMAIPPDAKELLERGISVDSDPKAK